MNISLTLSPEQQDALEKLAAAEGTDVAGHILRLLEHAIASGQNGPTAADLPYEQWQQDFETWLASHTSRNPNFDDTRESIYN